MHHQTFQALRASAALLVLLLLVGGVLAQLQPPVSTPPSDPSDAASSAGFSRGTGGFRAPTRTPGARPGLFSDNAMAEQTLALFLAEGASGDLLAAQILTGSVRVYNLTTRSLLSTYPAPAADFVLAEGSADPQLILLVAADGGLHLLALPDSAFTPGIVPIEGAQPPVALNSETPLLAARTADDRLGIWSLPPLVMANARATLLATSPRPLFDSVTALAFSAGRRVAAYPGNSATTDTGFTLYEYGEDNTLTLLDTFRLPFTPTDLRWSPLDRGLAAWGGPPQDVRLVRFTNRDLTRRTEAQLPVPPLGSAWLADANSTLLLWRDTRVLASLNDGSLVPLPHPGSALEGIVSVAQAGDRVLTLTRPGELYQWDVSAPRQPVRRTTVGVVVQALGSADDRLALLTENALLLWDFAVSAEPVSVALPSLPLRVLRLQDALVVLASDALLVYDVGDWLAPRLLGRIAIQLAPASSGGSSGF